MASQEAGPKRARYVSPRTVALYGVLTALTTAVTYASYTPFSPTKGYFNLGESMVFFSALTFGWRAGMICGGVGSAAADILLGSGIYAPITLVAKGIEGFMAGIIGRMEAGRGWAICAGLVGGVLAAIAFVWVLPGKLFGVDEWVFETVIFAVVLTAVYATFHFRKSAFKTWAPTVLGISFGGWFMVTTYFLGEYFFLDVGLGKALSEVPINVAQVVLGGTIGALLSYYVGKSYRPLTKKA